MASKYLQVQNYETFIIVCYNLKLLFTENPSFKDNLKDGIQSLQSVNLWKLMGDFNLHGITAPGNAFILHEVPNFRNFNTDSQIQLSYARTDSSVLKHMQKRLEGWAQAIYITVLQWRKSVELRVLLVYLMVLTQIYASINWYIQFRQLSIVKSCNLRKSRNIH